jgi:hypothetical protein
MVEWALSRGQCPCTKHLAPQTRMRFAGLTGIMASWRFATIFGYVSEKTGGSQRSVEHWRRGSGIAVGMRHVGRSEVAQASAGYIRQAQAAVDNAKAKLLMALTTALGVEAEPAR